MKKERNEPNSARSDLPKSFQVNERLAITIRSDIYEAKRWVGGGAGGKDLVDENMQILRTHLMIYRSRNINSFQIGFHIAKI